MPLSPDYIRLVLQENFEDAKALFLDPLCAIHEAHLVMLAETGIVSRDDARAIRSALQALDRDAVRRAVYDGSCEDLFFYVDRLIAGSAGPDRAGRLHTARSRNDIDMTMYRMRLRMWVLDLAEAATGLRRVVIDAATAHLHTVFPAHTHGQPAQPTTLAHYLMAIAEMLERDTRRLFAAFDATNVNPLGACAITGTGFPIDRERTSALLGFRGPTGNTYGSIAAVDYLLEASSAAAVVVTGVGRVLHDLLLWSTREVAYLRLSDELVQISSIMPQKRNPVALEHARSIASRAFAELGAIPAVVHNTPFGDIVDTEDDLQPLVARAFHDAVRAVSLVAVALEGAAFDVARMRTRADQDFVSVTELADVLAREYGLPFARAHEVVSAFVRAESREGESRAGRLRRAAAAHRVPLDVSDEQVERWLDPVHFVEVRRTHGGPAPEVVRAATDSSRATLTRDAARIEQARGAIEDADTARKRALEEI